MANRIRIASDTSGGSRTVDFTYAYSTICDKPKGPDSIRSRSKCVSNQRKSNRGNPVDCLQRYKDSAENTVFKQTQIANTSVRS